MHWHKLSLYLQVIIVSLIVACAPSKWENLSLNDVRQPNTAFSVVPSVPSRPGTRLTIPRTFRKWTEWLSRMSKRGTKSREQFFHVARYQWRHVSFLLKFSSKKLLKLPSQYRMLSVTLNTTRSVFLVKFLRCFQSIKELSHRKEFLAIQLIDCSNK